MTMQKADNQATSGAAAFAPCEGDMPKNWPLIAHDGEWRHDTRLITFMLQAIFRQASLDATLAGLAAKLETERNRVESLDELFTWLETELKAGGDATATYLKDVTECRAAVIRNIKAYKPEGYHNWRAVFWPDSSVPAPHGRSMYEDRELPYAKIHKILDRSTPIGSMGSCFAGEVKKFLKEDGFNYVEEEPNVNSSAAWGTLYHAPSMRQLVEKAFGLLETPRLLGSKKHFASDYTAQFKYADPFRQSIRFDSMDEYAEGYEQHLQTARNALMKTKVFIVTLGMNEVWYLRSDDSVLTRMLWDLSPALFEPRTLTVEQNVAELERMLEVWRAHNPDIKLIVSVSPVPLHATFQGSERHVIEATCHAKSVLRAAAGEFTSRHEGTYYFPSYETVMYCTEKPFIEDNRHVTREAVRKVKLLFETMFVKDAPDHLG